MGGAATGVIMGGIFGGIRAGSEALEGDASFWTGNKTLDTSKGVGAHSAAAKSIVNQGTIRAKYAGKYEDVNVYEHKSLGNGRYSSGLTLPPDTIIVGKGAYAVKNAFNETYDLFKHEFGHILQSREPFVGVKGFYKIIAPESLATSNTSFADSYWTETWANHLSKQYFGYGFYDSVRFPVKDISAFNRTKFLFK